MKVHVGCAGFALPKDEYLRTFRLLEINPPSLKTARRLKQQAQDDFVFVLKTEPDYEAWTATQAVCEAIGARIVLFQTPPSFTPTGAHREQLKRFLATTPRQGRIFVWEPRGLWEPAEVRALCQDLDLVHSVDPLQRPTTTKGVAYYRLQGLGRPGGAFGEVDLDKVLAACEDFDEAFVVFDNLAMATDARRFLALLS